MKKIMFWLLGVALFNLPLYSCTPLLVGGAAAGGAYAGYKFSEEGYRINITKPVKGKKASDNSTKTKE
ncbi:hypothetical protein [Hippea maritima]|uniref:Lipoprotein n=1 Tax=Hippea maritima (strain ATCC 700847 / DSM 10411 / MH2) TaxID=760142 RepID=F2LVH9_HIPMA|nr:hypothetical protein [Hippea maritima]AEA33763.1 hypothetical protein Hipma_0793 [Hippea maritima DSM 10411]